MGWLVGVWLAGLVGWLVGWLVGSINGLTDACRNHIDRLYNPSSFNHACMYDQPRPPAPTQVYIEDLREEFVKEYVFWAVKVRVDDGILYTNVYR